MTFFVLGMYTIAIIIMVVLVMYNFYLVDKIKKKNNEELEKIKSLRDDVFKDINNNKIEIDEIIEEMKNRIDKIQTENTSFKETFKRC